MRCGKEDVEWVGLISPSGPINLKPPLSSNGVWVCVSVDPKINRERDRSGPFLPCFVCLPYLLCLFARIGSYPFLLLFTTFCR